MKNYYFVGVILVTNTYTYILTKIYMYRNNLIIPNIDIPKNEHFK